MKSIWAVACVMALGLGCDFGLSGSGGGCAKISQTEFDFPAKRVVASSIAVRVTQTGVNFITERIKTLIRAFFETDAQGRAIIPLADLGLGEIETSLGPFDASARDLVLTLDLASLSVRLIPGSNPARIEITIVDADVGILSGTAAGSVDGFFSGNAACALHNGPNDRVALLSLTLVLELSTDVGGFLDVNVLPSTFDIQEVGVSLETDCDISECLDGLPPGDTGECLECETICPAIDVAAELASLLQQYFDGLVDTLLNALADDLANLFLDDLLNGRPLVVEGLLSLSDTFGPLLDWMRTARPLGVLGRPAGTAFRVTGVGDTLGLDLVLDAGLDAAPAHPCVGALGEDREWQAGPRPAFDGVLQSDDGVLFYDVAIGVSHAIINETIWALWKSGTLCIDATTDDLVTLTSNKLLVTAGTLDLLLPGVAGIAGADAPVRLAVRPNLRTAVNPNDIVAIGQGEALMTIALSDAEIRLDVLVGDAWMRLVSFEADLSLRVNLKVTADQKIQIEVAGVDLEGLNLPDNEIFAAARLDVIAPFVVDLALGFLSERPLTIDLGIGGLGEALGLPLVPVVKAMGAAGTNNDWLAIYVALEDPPAEPLPMLRAPPIDVESVEPGRALVRAGVGEGERFAVRVGGGAWESFVGPGPHVLASRRLWLLGTWALESRAIDERGRAGDSERVGEVEVRRAALSASTDEPVVDEPPPSDDGCAGGGAGSIVLVLVVFLPRRRWLGLVGLVACTEAGDAPERHCVGHDQCDDGFLCGPQGLCVVATECAHDDDCCPGAVCFSGWCRPTAECGPGRPCETLGEVCDGDQCVPAACDAASPCPEPTACVAGRCLLHEPCDGRCAADEVCDVAADRCRAAVCPLTCGEGWRVAVPATVSPYECAAPECVCGTALEVPHGRPGVDGVLGDGPTLVSYDPAYGDLVLSRFDAVGLRSDTVLDGAPTDAPRVAPATTYRGGFLDPGPDRGSAAAVAFGNRWDLIYRDNDTRKLKHLRVDPTSGAVEARSDLPIDGEVGRYTCVTRTDSTLRGLTFVSWDPNDRVSQLVAFEGNETGWSTHTVLETALPSRSDNPCGGTCGFGQLCVLDGGAGGFVEACADAIQLGGCDTACEPLSVCGAVGEAPAACHPRVYPRYDADRLPFGEGLFVSCDGDSAAWYDADDRQLVVAKFPFAPADRLRVDIAPGRDAGRHVAIVERAGGVTLAYQEATTDRLRIGEADGVLGTWTFSDVDAGGAWARIHEIGGQVVVVHGEPEAGDVRIAARTGACWATAPVLVDGGFAYPDVTAAPDGLWVTALGFAFEDDLDADHHPVLTRVTAPATCP